MDWVKKTGSNQDGFTLLEVMVAIVIITALVGTFAPLIVSSVQNIKWAGDRTQFLYDTRAKMEREMVLASKEKGLAADTVTVTQSGGTLDWAVRGKLVIHRFDEKGSDRDILVSFVVPQEWQEGD